MASGKRSALGNNPLNQGIFTKTEDKTEATQAPETIEKPSIQVKQESRKKNKDSRFLKDSRDEKVNLRLSIKMNDWLDDLLKKGKRRHGQKIPKEIWVQAALELFKAMPTKWEDVESEEQLIQELLNLESRIKNQDS